MKPNASCLMGAALSLALVLPAHSQGAAKAPDSSSARLAAQNALFDEQYASDLKEHPEQATARGDYEYNDKLEDTSLKGVKRRNGEDVAFRDRLKAISTAGFGDQDALSHELMLRMLDQRIENFRFKEFEMPVNQMDGPHLRLADLPLAVPFSSVRHYEDYIARLHAIPAYFQGVQEVLKTGATDHLMPVGFLLEKIPAQCEGVISANPFLRPTQKFPDSFTAEDRRRLTDAISEVISKEVIPAYRGFEAFIKETYAPQGRSTLSVESLAEGKARYLNDIRSRTTLSNLTPAQIHDIGLKEIERIEAEMLAIAKGQGFADLKSFRESLKTNPKYIPTSSEQILEDFLHHIDEMRPKLPELFGHIPKAPVTVEAIPDFQAASATHYVTGTPDGSHPGRVVVATSNFAHRTLIDDEATAYHEGIPGHHMQLSMAQEMTGLPKFRQHNGNSGFVEGWALYSEQLGKEIGFYKDPVSDYGRLASELFRAIRLVVDTGLHSQNWSRDQVVEFFRKYEAVDEPTIQSETDRYIAWPGQALSYKLGQLKFRELRERARMQLGTKFDIKAFHDEMIDNGVMPLDVLDIRTNAWIKKQKTG